MDAKQGIIDLKKRLETLMQKENRVRLLILLGALGMMLVLASEFWPKTKEEPIQTAATITSDVYVKQMEERIHELVTSIDGVGRARVMVTLESGVEYVYASTEKTNTDVTQDFSGDSMKKLHEKGNTESGYILVDGGNGKEALIKTQIEPTVKGVVVVCQGADSPVVQARVLAAVTTAFDLSSTQVCISKMADKTVK